MIKKILYIAFKYEYGLEKNGEALNKKAFHNNFIDLGYEVESVFFEDYNKEDLQKKIVEKVKEFNPDIVFFILQRDQVETNTLEELKQNNFFIVNWFGDDQWRFDNFSNKYANNFDLVITTDKFSVEKYKKIGQNCVIRSQWASLDSNIEYQSLNYKYDVSFIGGANPFRKWFVEQLQKRGIHVECFGSGWINGRISYTEMEEIFATSKINLNISNSTQYDIRYLFSHPRHVLSTFRGTKNRSQTKARIFEIPVQGGFELTEYVPSLEDYFDVGKEISCYKDIDECELLIKYYLKHEDEREKIKLKGVEKARLNHTYKHRIKSFLKEIEDKYL